MPVSEARKAAARINGAKSRGPTSPEGRDRSRRNSTQHGMAGSGLVVPLDDSAEVERRSIAMQAEMAPRTEMGRFLVGRLAELTVRVERCSKQERAATKRLSDHAEAAFDEARLAEVDHLMSYIANEPATHVRRLRAMPEGVDRLIAAFLELRDELEYGEQTRWDWTYGIRLADLTSSRYMDIPVTPVRALTQAIGGDFKDLLPGDGEGLSDPDRRAWARKGLVERIDAELEMLLEHRETLDLEAIESDRATASDRALFDASREAALARRYEAAAERGVYKALAELRRVEAEAAMVEAEAPDEGPAEESLGSSGAGDPAPSEEAAPPPRPAAPAVRARQDGPSERCSEGPKPVGPARPETA